MTDLDLMVSKYIQLDVEGVTPGKIHVSTVLLVYVEFYLQHRSYCMFNSYYTFE